MNKLVLRQSLLLLLAATIWGVAFVAQSVGMDYVGPYTFLASRSFLGAIVLLPVIYFKNKSKRKGTALNVEVEDTDSKVVVSAGKMSGTKQLIFAGICCGICLFVASILQQMGIMYTTVGKSGFITAMYIVVVPLLGIFFKKKAGVRIWCGVLLAVVGLYFLCMTPGNFILQKGDALTGLCAVAFSFHILVVDYFAPKLDGVKISCIQFLTCGILAFAGMLFFEQPSIASVLAAWLPILYAGALSSGVAYTLQIVGQRGLNPTVASLLMSMESVISVIAGWAILGQSLSGREIMGCVLMFCAIVLVQLPERLKK